MFKVYIFLYLPHVLFQKPENGKYVPSVMFDGANGVGAMKLEAGLLHLHDSLQVQLYNNGTGQLNYKVSNEGTIIKTIHGYFFLFFPVLLHTACLKMYV